jgi:hypothetical protein
VPAKPHKRQQSAKPFNRAESKELVRPQPKQVEPLSARVFKRKPQPLESPEQPLSLDELRRANYYHKRLSSKARPKSIINGDIKITGRGNEYQDIDKFLPKDLLGICASSLYFKHKEAVPEADAPNESTVTAPVEECKQIQALKKINKMRNALI